MNIPVIVGYGGINPAGRGSGDIAYLRTVIDAVGRKKEQETILALSSLMERITFQESGGWIDQQGQSLTEDQMLERYKEDVLKNTLIRKISSDFDFDPDNILHHIPVEIDSLENSSLKLKLQKMHREFCSNLPEGIRLEESGGDGDASEPHLISNTQIKLSAHLSKVFEVKSAGILPDGFNAKNLYRCKQHPKGLQLTIYGASDAIHSLGLDIGDVMNLVQPNEVGVYVASSLGQCDEFSMAGYTQSNLLGQKTTSRQMPFGMPQMPADFVNSYILGSVGKTCGIIGACATFLYNLQKAVEDIKSGACRVAIVGSSEAPVNISVMRAFKAMGALAEDQGLMDLDSISDPSDLDHIRACRPFSNNCGFVISESSQFIILFDDKLALETGANIHGFIPEVFVNADGYKGSISKPGVGNLISFAQAAAMARAVVGQKALSENAVVYAHGTGTPQNRVSESRIMSETAKLFSVKNWQVAAVKSFLGHPLGPASGDQINHLLGFWKHGILPGIKTIDELASDVHTDRLQFNLDHVEIPPENISVGLINSKGFGGNNATAVAVSPTETFKILKHRHTKSAIAEYRKKNEKVAEQSAKNSEMITRQKLLPIYNQNGRILNDDEVRITTDSIKVSGFEQELKLTSSNPFK